MGREGCEMYSQNEMRILDAGFRLNRKSSVE